MDDAFVIPSTNASERQSCPGPTSGAVAVGQRSVAKKALPQTAAMSAGAGVPVAPPDHVPDARPPQRLGCRTQDSVACGSSCQHKVP